MEGRAGPVMPVICSPDVCRADSQWLATPFGGWLGSGAEEGRAKQRNVPGRRKEPLIRQSPNGTSCLLAIRKDGERRESKHPSTCRKRNQTRCR